MAYSTVTTQADVVGPSDAQLSLREAVAQANATALLLFRSGRMELQMKTIVVAGLLATAAPGAMAKDIPPDASTMVNVPFGTSITGYAEYTGDKDAYRVSIQKGQYFGVSAHGFSNSAVTAVKLFDRNFHLLKTAIIRVDSNAWVDYLSTYSGNYYVQVTAQKTEPLSSERGAYWFNIDSDCPGDRTTTCQLGTSAGNGWIMSKADADWFVWNITKAKTYRVGVYGPNIIDKTKIWGGGISIRRLDTSTIADSNNSTANCDEAGPCIDIALQPGKYFVAVRAGLGSDWSEYKTYFYQNPSPPS